MALESRMTAFSKLATRGLWLLSKCFCEFATLLRIFLGFFLNIELQRIVVEK